MGAKKKKPVKKNDIIPIGDGVYQQAFAFASEAFRSGLSEIYVAEQIKKGWPMLSDINVQLVIKKGSELISHQHARDSSSVISIHTKRYDKEIKQLMEQKYEGLIDEEEELEGGGDMGMKRRKLRLAALHRVIDVMFAKEQVLQIHNKETQVKIFNKLNAKVKERKQVFDLSGLSLEEMTEFLSLIQKAKLSDRELLGIQHRQEEQEIEEAQYEIIENDNVNKIKEVNHPVKKTKPKKRLQDVTDAIHNNLARKALLSFRRKGGDKGGPHIIDKTGED